MSRLAIGSALLFAALVSACTDPAEITTVSQLPGGALSSVTTTVVMSDLNSPRGLAWGPEGGLYVAEAGTLSSTGDCVPFMEGPMLATRCYSGTGSVSRLWHGVQERVVTGLPSTFIVENQLAAGPQAISFKGRGSATVALGWGGGAPDAREGLGADAANLGTVIQLTPAGYWRVVADLAAYEGTFNPAGGRIDSNPFGVLAEGDRTYVADAGANALFEVSAAGRISVVATFPPTPAVPPFNSAEAVPTKVRRGPDGALYVSTLSGVPFQDGSAMIYRVVPGQPPQVYAGGFKAITDFAFAPDGGMYVVQFSSGFLFFDGPGLLIHVAPDGTRTVLVADLFQPTGVVVGTDGSVYVTNKGTLAGTGEVLRIVP